MQVSKWLAHSTYTLTLDVYGDWISEEDGGAVNPLPEPTAPAKTSQGAKMLRRAVDEISEMQAEARAEAEALIAGDQGRSRGRAAKAQRAVGGHGRKAKRPRSRV